MLRYKRALKVLLLAIRICKATAEHIHRRAGCTAPCWLLDSASAGAALLQCVSGRTAAIAARAVQHAGS
jgi:hypothetical protein